VSTITVADMTYAGNLVRLGSNESAPVYTLLLVLYFLLAFVLTRGMRAVERHARAGVGQAPPRRRRGAAGAATGTEAVTVGGAR
jgi:polar amino acid transport system permease protein